MNNLPIIGIVQRTRKSPYFAATLRAGAKGFTVYNHMLMPIYYESPEADYWHLMTNVSMWDVACERQVEITGPDALRLAQLLTPRDLSQCQVGQGKYVPLVDEKGGMINDPVLLRLGENHFWLSLADSDVLLWAKGVALGYGLAVNLREPDVSPLAIQGPKAEQVTAALLGEWVKNLRFFWFKETHLGEIPLVVARSGWSKQGGFELYLRDSRYGEELWERVAAVGQPYGIAPGTPSAIERIESGLLSYGNDMTLENNPFEIGLGKYCDLDKEGLPGALGSMILPPSGSAWRIEPDQK
jgi:glycine cleavage system aminomethyltransferase T